MSSLLNDLKPILQIAEQTPLELMPFILGFIFLLLAIQWGKKRHVLSKLEASQHLRRLKKIEEPAKQITYIRRVDPFVFEEMVLTAIKKQGHKIIRNKRYTGDGGIDGQAIVNNQHYLIQSKRYKGHINPAHVIEFAAICKRQDKRGLFVHTGKTGAKSLQVAKNTNMDMISGNRLLNLLLNQPKSLNT